MAINIHLGVPNDIGAAIEQLHDWYFDLDAIIRDSAVRQIRIPFCERKGDLWTKNYQRWLIIDGVMKIDIIDTERIGFYDLNLIVYKNGRLIIESAVPLKLEMEVNWSA